MRKGTSAATKAKNTKMVKLILEKGMDQNKAYAISRGHKEVLRSSSVRAWEIMSKPETQAMMQQMRSRFLMDAPKAYTLGWEKAEDPTTPPNVSMKWFSEVLDRGGLGGVDLSLHKHEHTHKYPEFMKSKEEIIAMMEEPESAEEIEKRNE